MKPPTMLTHLHAHTHTHARAHAHARARTRARAHAHARYICHPTWRQRWAPWGIESSVGKTITKAETAFISPSSCVSLGCCTLKRECTEGMRSAYVCVYAFVGGGFRDVCRVASGGKCCLAERAPCFICALFTLLTSGCHPKMVPMNTATGGL